MTDWRSELDERQRSELMFALMYEADYHHGTDGHGRLMLIAKLAHLLDELTDTAIALSERE